jgi:ribosomal protein S18 acetylase RimI-like enzyme
MNLEIAEADFTNPTHTRAMLGLLDAYASGLSGGGCGLSAFAKAHLPAALAQRSTARVLLAFAEGIPAGLAIAFEGFSTFQCQPLLNVHDVVVAENFRGRGIAKRLLAEMEAIALRTGCCKLTLEVLEGNVAAQNLYRSLGFESYQLDPAMGRALFWEKKLGAPEVPDASSTPPCPPLHES